MVATLQQRPGAGGSHQGQPGPGGEGMALARLAAAAAQQVEHVVEQGGAAVLPVATRLQLKQILRPEGAAEAIGPQALALQQGPLRLAGG